MSIKSNEKFPIVNLKLSGNANSFVKCWRSFYNYKNENVYKKHINTRAFTSNDIKILLRWKNNMDLSAKKLVSQKRITKRIRTIQKLQKDFDIDLFNESFKKISTIWKVFLLHIIQPEVYPIYDQHVHRAFKYIDNKKIEELPKSNTAKYSLYLNEYLKFFNEFKSKANRFSVKEIDEALWAFGKQLKENPNIFTAMASV